MHTYKTRLDKEFPVDYNFNRKMCYFVEKKKRGHEN